MCDESFYSLVTYIVSIKIMDSYFADFDYSGLFLKLNPAINEGPLYIHSFDTSLTITASELEKLEFKYLPRIVITSAQIWLSILSVIDIILSIRDCSLFTEGWVLKIN